MADFQRVETEHAEPHVVLGPTTTRQIAFVGPLGVGKTTAVRTISDVRVVSTEMPRAILAVTGDDLIDKRTTTVGIDYGEWTDPTGRRIALIGTPGQVRFTSTRTSAVAGATRIVLWVYGNHPDALGQTRDWIERTGGPAVWERLVIAVTRREDEHAVPLARFEACAREYHPGIAVRDADPREREDVSRIILTALADS